MITSDDIGKVVSFEIYPASIIPTNYKRCRVLGILDHESASHLIPVAERAIAVYPTLPNGTPKDWLRYRYLKVALSNGNNSVVALEWIKPDTIVIHEDITASFTVSKINADDVTEITKLLKAHNYDSVQVTIV